AARAPDPAGHAGVSSPDPCVRVPAPARRIREMESRLGGLDASVAGAELGVLDPVPPDLDGVPSVDALAGGGTRPRRRVLCRHDAAVLGPLVRAHAGTPRAAALDTPRLQRGERGGRRTAGLRPGAMDAGGVLTHHAGECDGA